MLVSSLQLACGDRFMPVASVAAGPWERPAAGLIVTSLAGRHPAP
ncbi:hypothetical protein ACFZCU_41790 [Streptomyces canus]